jgi:S1-C subfamily serine protease
MEVVLMSSQLIELSDALAQATQNAAASAVAVHTESRGSSSGVIWRPGVMVTAEHALRRDEEIHVTLPDGRVVAAALAGRDPSTDLAVLKCAEAGSPATGSAPQFGDAAALKPGSLTLVVGRTRASGPVAALGVVSLVAPQRQAWTGASLAPYIRLDVSLQPTAAGGAVVDGRGQIVGIATPRFGRFGVVVIPAATVNSVTDTLLQKGRVPRGYLGVGLQPVRLPDALRQSLQREEKSAAIVLEVEPDGPANKAGIVIGDIFVALAGQQVARLEDVHSQLQGAAIGKALDLKFIRGGAIQETTNTVGERHTGGE